MGIHFSNNPSGNLVIVKLVLENCFTTQFVFNLSSLVYINRDAESNNESICFHDSVTVKLTYHIGGFLVFRLKPFTPSPPDVTHLFLFWSIFLCNSAKYIWLLLPVVENSFTHFWLSIIEKQFFGMLLD